MPKQETSDTLVTLGRGIALDSKGDWRSTPYFTKAVISQGRGGPRPVSGVFDNKVNPDEFDEEGKPKYMVGGANANVLALYHLYHQLDIQGTPPKLVVFAAGKPRYLGDDIPDDLTEGGVMSEKFMQKLAVRSLSVPEILILRQNQNTFDDMNNSLQAAQERGLNSIAFVTIALQIRRADAFLRKLLADGLGWEGLNCTFIPSEKVLSEVDDRYKKAFRDIGKTIPYRNNVFYETRGLRAFRSDAY